MATVERVKVCGISFFDDEIDGKRVDSGSCFVEESLDFTSGRAKGYATQKYRLANSAAAKALMAAHEFPVLCDVEFIRVTNGRESKNVVGAIKAVDQASARKGA